MTSLSLSVHSKPPLRPADSTAPTQGQTVYLFGAQAVSSQIEEFPSDDTDSGAPMPSNVITDAAGNQNPKGYAIDAAGDLFVGYNPSLPATGALPSVIAEYPAGSSGLTVPTRTVSSGSTLEGIVSIADGTDGSIYALATPSGCAEPELLVYAPGASGIVSPTRLIGGSRTMLGIGGHAIAVDKDGNVYVAQTSPDEVLVFARNANGNAAPIRILSGGATMLADPTSIAITPSGLLAIYDFTTQTITEYAETATGNAAPSNSFTTTQSGDEVTLMAADSTSDYWVYQHVPQGGGDFLHRLVEFAPNATGNASFVWDIDPYNPTDSFVVYGLLVQ